MKHLIALFALAVCAFGQTSAPTVSSFTLALSPISLPGNHQTVAGTEAGLSLGVTQNLDVIDQNIVAPGDNFQYFGGGVQYRLPVLSTKLNNASPNLNGLKFQFGLKASVGVDRLTAINAQHWAFTAGGFVNYSINNTWAFGGQVEYGHFSGFNQRAVLVSVGPQLHF
jgi:hypothetical protein